MKYLMCDGPICISPFSHRKFSSTIRSCDSVPDYVHDLSFQSKQRLAVELLRIGNLDKTALWSRNSALDHQNSGLAVRVQNLVVEHCAIAPTHTTGHFLARQNSTWVLGGTHGTSRSVGNRNTVCGTQTLEAVSLHDTSKTFTFRNGFNVHKSAHREIVGGDFGAWRYNAVVCSHTELAELGLGRHAGVRAELHVVARDVLQLVDSAHQNRRVAVFFHRLVGNHLARVHFDHRGAKSLAALREPRNHVSFNAKKTWSLQQRLSLVGKRQRVVDLRLGSDGQRNRMDGCDAGSAARKDNVSEPAGSFQAVSQPESPCHS
ncbi:hypothetical protein CLUG_04348 [Clavispora lusitaniae ATCC 42720]|uniref:Uncharacterized protein n=1 Tax=Clavispora lusitaniae (strain ATCC 42720) TaxID=306902 RepID=C4Y820_CLAL4|nr:uncharacterized protein CLUG_04348 [Clavispora lusitaniae ATCC 42720]EEQ40221.1 hypothetical protein CLUG_04348 [Clavispora lusitaniae ATCC 42720]